VTLSSKSLLLAQRSLLLDCSVLPSVLGLIWAKRGISPLPLSTLCPWRTPLALFLPCRAVSLVKLTLLPFPTTSPLLPLFLFQVAKKSPASYPLFPICLYSALFICLQFPPFPSACSGKLKISLLRLCFNRYKLCRRRQPVLILPSSISLNLLVAAFTTGFLLPPATQLNSLVRSSATTP
jgi:hypothetical protein